MFARNGLEHDPCGCAIRELATKCGGVRVNLSGLPTVRFFEKWRRKAVFTTAVVQIRQEGGMYLASSDDPPGLQLVSRFQADVEADIPAAIAYLYRVNTRIDVQVRQSTKVLPFPKPVLVPDRSQPPPGNSVTASRVHARDQWSPMLLGAGFRHLQEADHLGRTLAEIWVDPDGRHIHVPYVEDSRGERVVLEFTLHRLAADDG